MAPGTILNRACQLPGSVDGWIRPARTHGTGTPSTPMAICFRSRGLGGVTSAEPQSLE